MTRPAAERLDALAAKLTALEQRVVLLEAARAAHPVATAAHAPAPAADIGETALPLAGRTLVALGAGYLLRALGASGLVPPLVAAALGCAYAAGWLLFAVRDTRGASAAFGLVTSALVVYPMLWETVTRFRSIGIAAALALAVVFAGAALRVAPNGWALVHVVPAGILLLALLAWGHDLAASLAAATVLHGLGEWARRRHGREAAPWATAPVYVLTAIAALYLTGRADGLPEAWAPVDPGAVVAAVLVGCGALLVLSAVETRTAAPLPLLTVLRALTAVVLALALVPPRARPWAFLAAGFVASALATRGWVARSASVLLVLAGLAGCGTLAAAMRVLAGVPLGDGGGRIATSGLAAVLFYATTRACEPPAARLVAAFTAAAGALAVAGVLPGPYGGRATGTVMLAAAAPALLARAGARDELRWLAFVVLVLGGLRLMLVDLAAGTPATTFVALVSYGTALLLVHRLRGIRRGDGAAARPSSPTGP